MTIVDVVVIVCDCVSGAALIGAGGYAVAMHRRARSARRRATSVEALDAALQRWRLEKRLLRARALQAWQADFDALLPPAPSCTSSEHNHVENYRIGSQRVERICVVRPPYSVGGITAQEAVQVLQRLAVPQRAVMLSPGERVLSRDEIESIRRQAEARARRGF